MLKSNTDKQKAQYDKTVHEQQQQQQQQQKSLFKTCKLQIIT